jgi:hypothetical protein
MTMFPQLSDTYYVDNDHDLLKLMDYTYAKYIQINQSFWSEADIDSRFKSGMQDYTNDIYGNLPAFRRRTFNFNRIRRIINMISGYQRQHRKSTICEAVQDSNSKTADQFTKLLFHANKDGNILETVSDAFEGAITTGMNLLGVWMDYRQDPVNGDIRVDNLNYNQYLIDPYFRNMDLSDCNSLWTRKYLSRTQIMSLLPGREDEIKNMCGWGNRDGKFQFEPESYAYGMQDLIIFDEFWYLDSREQKMLVDVETGETTEWRGDDEDLHDFVRMFPSLIIQKHHIPTVKLGIVVQGKTMYNGPNPLGIDKYPFVPMWCYYEPQIPYFPWRVQGVVRGLRDSQYLYNRRKVIELDILESQITSGWKYKENALVNPKDVFLQGQGRGLAMKADSQMTDAERILPPAIDPSMIQLSELLGNEMQQIAGISDELLGMADDDKAGILSMVRQGANLTTLQCIFDYADRSQKYLGDMCIELMQANWTPGKIKRIVGEDPTDQFYNKVFGKYDAVIVEAPLTTTQRQLELNQLLYLREIGVPVPTSRIIKIMNVGDKEELINEITQAEQAESEKQQQQHDLQLQALQIDADTKHAYSESQKALAAERLNKVQLDAAVSAERIQKAQTDRTGAELNIIRALKELQGIDISHLDQQLNILHTIDEKERAKNQHNISGNA